MNIVQFKDLHKLEFDLHNISMVRQFWRDREVYRTPDGGRKDNGLMFLSDCSFEYLTPDGKMDEQAFGGSIVYAPKGANYICRSNLGGRQFGSMESSNYLINFVLTDEKGEEFILSNDRIIFLTDKKKYYLDSFIRINAIAKQWLSPSARIKSLLYDLLCDLSLDLQKNDIMHRNFAPIYPAIKYIQTTDLASIDPTSLSELCQISRSCFYRLFREYTGMAPLEYINHLKIKQAQKMLQGGILNVTEVAEALGFTDVSYFSRFYKKTTGHSPSADLKYS